MAEPPGVTASGSTPTPAGSGLPALGVNAHTQPIAITDIARYVAGVCGNPEAIGQTYDAGGPEVMTYRQMIERIAR